MLDLLDRPVNNGSLSFSDAAGLMGEAKPAVKGVLGFQCAELVVGVAVAVLETVGNETGLGQAGWGDSRLSCRSG